MAGRVAGRGAGPDAGRCRPGRCSRGCAGQRHPRGSLDIVVEGAELHAVLLEESERIPGGEVLELYDGPGEHLRDGLEELVHQLVVRLAAEAVPGDAEIERIVQELLVVRPDVQGYRQGQGGVDSCASAVERQLADGNAHPECAEVADDSPVGLIAKKPNDVWHVDLTSVPTVGGGFWVPWSPFAKILRWPFAWWVAVAVDQASRRLMGFAAFTQRPDSGQVTAFLDRAMKRAGTGPKHIVTDKGKEFFCRPFRGWCRRRGIRPRTGAVGEHASIAIVERFIRSMKSECTRRILVPFQLARFRAELARAAAIFISMLIPVACTSSAPRKMNGKPSTLLIWFG